MTIPWELITTMVVAVFASTGFWNLVISIYNKRTKKQSDETKLLLGVAHNMIFDKCEKYTKRGSITPAELDDLLYLYTPYEAFGGNGTAKLMVEQLKKNVPVIQD